MDDAPSGGTAAADGAGATDGESAGADPSLVALGAVGISNLYFGYVALASVADGFASGAYAEDTASALARESIAFHESARSALEKLLSEGDIAPEEQPVLRQMIRAHDLLIQEARGLIRFVSSPGDSEAFRRYRDQAWEVISELLAGEGEVTTP